MDTEGHSCDRRRGGENRGVWRRSHSQETPARGEIRAIPSSLGDGGERPVEGTGRQRRPTEPDLRAHFRASENARPNARERARREAKLRRNRGRGAASGL